MSYLGIVLGSVFGANALLVYGFGLRPAFLREGGRPLSNLLALGLSSLLGALFLWALRSFILLPLGLDRFELLFFLLLGIPLLRYLGRLSLREGEASSGDFARSMEEAAPSSLVFGLALVASRSDFGLLEAAAATLASVLGYWAALVLLDAIRERLELSDIPPAFKGPPALLISIGLMALAFMGLDAVLIRNLAG